MLQLTSSTILFFSTMMFGTIYSLSSSSFLMIWMGMEINMLSFTPLILSSNKWHEAQAAFIYLYSQATGSLLFLSSIILQNIPCENTIWPIFPMLIIPALLLKAGAAPCHFWMPLVMERMNWFPCFLLATWQKFLPLFIFSKMMFLPYFTASPFITSIVLMGVIMGSLGGLNQTDLRPLLTFSSIQHMAWVIMASMFSFSLSILYLTIYLFATVCLFFKLMFWMMYTPPQMLPFSLFNSTENAMLKITLMSITGLPPLMGFYPKMITLCFMIKQSMWLPAYIMIVCNSISLVYYLRVYLATNMTVNGSAYTTTPAPLNSFPYATLVAIFIYFAPAMYLIIS